MTDGDSFFSAAFEQFHLIQAKVPILRFRDTANHIEVDLNYNNSVGIRNTHLLYCYSKCEFINGEEEGVCLTDDLFHSGLASSSIGFGRETMGEISGHQQREEHDNLELFVGPNGHSLFAERRLALRVALSAHHVSGQVSGEWTGDSLWMLWGYEI